MEVNARPVIAFVDSGAQQTISKYSIIPLLVVIEHGPLRFSESRMCRIMWVSTCRLEVIECHPPDPSFHQGLCDL